MDKKYIKFIEGDVEDLKKACQLAEENGYKLHLDSRALFFEGHGILKCDSDGYYGTSPYEDYILINNGYTEIKRTKKFVKYPNGSKAKIIANHTHHGLKIGDIVKVKYTCVDSTGKGFGYNVIEPKSPGWYLTSLDIELVEEFEIEFKVGDIIKFKTGNTRYVIVEVLDTEYKYKHLGNGKVFGCSKDSAIEVLDKTSEDYEYIFKNCKYILDTIEWKERCNNFTKNNIEPANDLREELYTHTSTAFAYALESTLTGTNTGCIDYAISYLDTSTCTVNKQGTILNNNINNNTMEKLNQLRADKFFSKESNLVSIEYLDALLKRSIDLVVSTKEELDRVQSKLIGLNKKLESATNNQDVATLKDLITSTKVIQDFVDELKGKTISKFESAKTKFDVAEYLKN